ncbi:MAG: primase [Thermoleophilaceae bacterium]|jgi:DNA primase|nr:primase [Thermoleophilaceae bacterium]
MSLYTKDSIDRLKDAVDMVELVGARTDLKRVGSKWSGLCPFHDERTPSFTVDAEHKLYHCFGCGEGGDAIRFVESTEGLDFRESVELLADRYRVELRREQEDPKAEERRKRLERLQSLVERATAFYERYLWESTEAARAREYLAGRGFDEAILRQFRVGYSPSAWDKLLLGAQRDGFSQEELAAAGLVQRGQQGKVYDRFRGRVMFPLADYRGRVLGFGARSLREDQRPKYLNTSENELYHKGRQLFGIDRAASQAAKRGRIVAVEGYTDVLALHQAGITESVAIMGTALTQQQLTALAQRVGKDGTVYLALDADRAGQDAMRRAARGARDLDLELRVVEMPEGNDPAELVAAEGADGFSRRIDGARLVPDFEARRVVAQADLSSPRGRDRALEQVRPLVDALSDDFTTRDELVEFLADKLNVPLDLLTAEVAAAPRRSAAPNEPAPVVTPAPSDAVARTERTFLAMCLAGGEQGRECLERLEDEHFSSDMLRRARAHLAEHFEDPLADLPSEDPALSALVTDIAMREEEVTDRLLELTFGQLELRRVQRLLRRAEREGDLDRQRELAPEQVRIKNQINELMGQAV